MRSPVVLALAYCLAMRVFELVLSRIHARRIVARGGRVVPNDGMVAIATVHASWFVAFGAEELLLGPSFESPVVRTVFAGLFVLAELVRLWCIRSLGERWNVRVVVLDGTPLAVGGPYRFLRHPNYIAAAVSLVALPLALGLVITPAAVVIPKVITLRRRIRIEDEALTA